MPIHKVGPGFIQWCLNLFKFTTDPIQTGNGQFGFNSGPYFSAQNFGAFDPAGYMDPSSLTGLVHPPESTQGLRHGPRQE